MLFILKIMELFCGNTDFPKAVLELQGCVFVCVHTPSMYRVLQELVPTLAAAPLYIPAKFFFNCEFPFPELNFSPLKPPSSRSDWQLNSAPEGKGCSITEPSVLPCMLAHSNLKMLSNVAAWEAGTAQRHSLIIPLWTGPCCLLPA